MRFHRAKMLSVTCEILARKSVIEILERHGIKSYTTYDVDGSGSSGIRGRGLQNEKNAKVEVITGDENRLHDAAEEISRTLFADYAIVLYVSDVGVLRPEKF